MKSPILAAAAAAAMLCAAPGALAAQRLELTPVGEGGSMSGGFSNIGVVGSDFNNVFAFTLPTAGKMSATISSIFLDAAEDIDFHSVTLDGQEFAIRSTGEVEVRTLRDLVVSAGTHTLIVRGTNGGNGSYSGTLAFASDTVAAVPEPVSWALMILGFAGAGAALRRRSAPATC